MIRRLFNWLAGSSLLLALLCAGLWIRSEQSAVIATRVVADGASDHAMLHQELAIDRGIFFWNSQAISGDSAPAGWSLRAASDAVEMHGPTTQLADSTFRDQATRVGFRFIHEKAGANSFTIVQFPLWSGTIIFLLIPLLWLQRRGFLREKKIAHCGQCGEDLRDATNGVCRRCGTRFART